jgi:glycogen synthase
MRALITTDTVGGVWRFTQELCAGLLEAGDTVALLGFGRLPSPAQQADCMRLATAWGEAFCFEGSDVPLEWMQNNPRCFEAGATVIRKLAERFEPDLVHSNQFCWGAMELGIPKVVTAHSDVLSWARACRGGGLEESPWIARYRTLVQRGLDGADVVTAPTRWMLDALGEGFRLAGDTSVIPNGIEIRPASAGARRLHAVTAGRIWDEAKDVALLEQVRSPIPLIAAGDPVCPDTSTLCPVPRFSGVKLLGALGHRALLQLFRESTIYLCTSLYEPFGLAPLEAALCGCAVLARRIGSLEEVWGDSAHYFEDAEELSALLAWLYEDPESLHKAQRQAAVRAARYSAHEMVGSYRALYSAIRESASVC